MFRFLQSLRFRLFALVILALLPGLAVILYENLEQRRQAIVQAQDNLQWLVAQVAREHTQVIHRARQLLQALARLQEVRRRDVAASEATFARILKDAPGYDNIGAIGTDGYVFATVQPITTPVYQGDREHVQQAIKTREFAVSKLQISRILQKATLVCTYPVLDEAGQVQAVLFANLSIDWLHSLSLQTRLPAGSVLAIVDDQGTLMAGYPDPEKWVGESLLKEGRFDYIKKHGKGITEAIGIDSVPRLYAFTTLGREPRLGFAYAGIPTQEVYAAANRTLGRDLAAMGLALLLALVGSWMFGNLIIMRRMDPLMRATERLSAGDLEARTDLTGGPDEFGQLAHAFDQMAASLQEREAERQQAEAALRESEEKYRLLVTNVPAMVYKGYVDWTVDFFDKKIEELIGLPREDFDSRRVKWSDLILAQDLEKANEAVKQALKTDKSFVREYRIRGQLDTIHWIRDRGRIICDQDGRINYITGTFADITEQKAMDEALRAERDFIAALLETIGALVVVLDREGRIVRFNHTCELATGYLSDLVRGKHYWDLFLPAAEIEPAKTYFQQLQAGNFPSCYEGYWVGLDSSQRLINWTNTCLVGDDGTVQFVIGTGIDITARKQAEEALQSSEERVRKDKAFLETIVNGIVDHMMVIDLDYQIIEVNWALLEMVGMKREEVVGRHCYEVSHHLKVPCTIPDHPCPLKEVVATGKAASATHVHFDKDGREHYYHVVCHPLYDREGRIHQVVDLSRDITQEINARMRMLHDDKMTSLGKLAASVVHELNNPLTGILNFVKLMERMLDGEAPGEEDLADIRRYLTMIHSETSRVSKTVANLLAFSRKTEPEFTPVNVNAVLAETLSLSEYQLRLQGIMVKRSLSSVLLPVLADPGQLKQAFLNLLLNAQDAMPQGGTLTLETKNSRGKGVVVQISDTGVGIPKDYFSKIFEPFYTTKKVGSGVGLGLSVVYGIVRDHKGIINVDSVVGQGTTFTIRLPAYKPGDASAAT